MAKRILKTEYVIASAKESKGKRMIVFRSYDLGSTPVVESFG